MESRVNEFKRKLPVWQPRVEDFLEVKIENIEIKTTGEGITDLMSFARNRLYAERNLKTKDGKFDFWVKNVLLNCAFEPALRLYAPLAFNAFVVSGKNNVYCSEIMLWFQKVNRPVDVTLVHELSHIAHVDFAPGDQNRKIPSYLKEGFAEQVTGIVVKPYGLSSYVPDTYKDELARFRNEGGDIKEGKELKRFMLEKSAEARARQ